MKKWAVLVAVNSVNDCGTFHLMSYGFLSNKHAWIIIAGVLARATINIITNYTQQ